MTAVFYITVVSLVLPMLAFISEVLAFSDRF